LNFCHLNFDPCFEFRALFLIICSLVVSRQGAAGLAGAGVSSSSDELLITPTVAAATATVPAARRPAGIPATAAPAAAPPAAAPPADPAAAPPLSALPAA
jgi:hypothetical protein